MIGSSCGVLARYTTASKIISGFYMATPFARFGKLASGIPVYSTWQFGGSIKL